MLQIPTVQSREHMSFTRLGPVSGSCWNWPVKLDRLSSTYNEILTLLITYSRDHLRNCPPKFTPRVASFGNFVDISGYHYFKAASSVAFELEIYKNLKKTGQLFLLGEYYAISTGTT